MYDNLLLEMYLIILFIFIFSLQLEGNYVINLFFFNLTIIQKKKKNVKINFYFTSDTQILAQQPSAYCFKFTWLGPMIDENSKKVNCTKDHKNNPCFQPFITTRNYRYKLIFKKII